MTAGAIVFALISLLLIAILPAVIGFLPFGDFGKKVASVLRWPVLLAIVVVGLAAIYRYGPCRSEPRWRWVSWGATVATVLWLAGSALFSVYVGEFANYNKSYGSLRGRGAADVALSERLRRATGSRAQCRDGASDRARHHHRPRGADGRARRQNGRYRRAGLAPLRAERPQPKGSARSQRCKCHAGHAEAHHCGRRPTESAQPAFDGESAHNARVTADVHRRRHYRHRDDTVDDGAPVERFDGVDGHYVDQDSDNRRGGESCIEGTGLLGLPRQSHRPSAPLAD